MIIKEIIQAIEEFAPRSWQENWDNTGTQIGPLDNELTGIILSLDMTEAALDCAIENNANLIITHHPMLRDGLKSINDQSNEARLVYKAIRSGIAIYSSHTSIDSAPGGINTTLAQHIVGLIDSTPLECNATDHTVGLGAIGNIKSTDSRGISIADLTARLKSKLNLEVLRISREAAPTQMVKRIALCGGSGSSLIDNALKLGAEVMITGDLKYGDFQRCRNSIIIIDIGHWESENIVLDIFYEIISKKFPNFADRIHRFNSNHVNYII